MSRIYLEKSTIISSLYATSRHYEFVNLNGFSFMPRDFFLVKERYRQKWINQFQKRPLYYLLCLTSDDFILKIRHKERNLRQQRLKCNLVLSCSMHVCFSFPITLYVNQILVIHARIAKFCTAYNTKSFVHYRCNRCA